MVNSHDWTGDESVGYVGGVRGCIWSVGGISETMIPSRSPHVLWIEDFAVLMIASVLYRLGHGNEE